MKVLLGTDADGVQVWGRLPNNNVTVAQVIGLFNVGTGTVAAPAPLPLPVRTVNTAAVGNPGDANYVPAGSHQVHDFEFRFFRPNRVVSAPGIFTVRAELFDGSILAGVTEVSNNAVDGIGSSAGTTVTATDATLGAGYTITIETTNGRTNVANNTVVTDWFTNLPAGLVATVNQVQLSGARVRIAITGTTTDTTPIARNLDIVIPASAVVDSDDPLPVTNPTYGGSPYARARIAIAAYGGGAVTPTLTLSDPSVSITTASPTATITIGGTADGTVTIDDSALPTYITAMVSADYTTITITGSTPSVDIDATFVVAVTREGVTETFEVIADLES